MSVRGGSSQDTTVARVGGGTAGHDGSRRGGLGRGNSGRGGDARRGGRAERARPSTSASGILRAMPGEVTGADIDVTQLRYFVASARRGSMSEGARSLFVSEQALSKGIRRLEATLGTDLLVRDHGGVRVTEFGAFFLKRAELALAALDLAARSVRDFAAETRRSITIGMPNKCMTDYGGSLNVQRLYELQRAYPDTEFAFVEATAESIRRHVDDGSYRFGIGRAAPGGGYHRVTLATFPMVAVVSERGPLGRLAQVTPADLLGCRVVITRGDESLASLVGILGREAGAIIPTLPVSLAPMDPGELIVSDDVVAIEPEQHATRCVVTPGVRLVPLANMRGARVSAPLELWWKVGAPLCDAERGVIEYLRHVYADRLPTNLSARTLSTGG